MGLCKDCRHWREGERPEYDHHTPEGVFLCGASDGPTKAATPPVAMSVHPDAGYIGEIYTGPDFGCVKFQPRG